MNMAENICMPKMSRAQKGLLFGRSLSCGEGLLRNENLASRYPKTPSLARV